MIFGIIYKVTCLVTNKSYIGQTTQPLDFYVKSHHFYNALRGVGKTRPFYKAIRKYGPSNFCWLTISEHASRIELDREEIRLILLHETHRKGYNATIEMMPSFLGCTHSKKNKIKFSDNKKQLWSDSIWRENQLNAYKTRNRQHNAKEMVLITPTGDKIKLEVGLETFCKQNNLPFTTMRKWVNKGKIHFNRHVRQSITRNAEEWEVMSAAQYYS